MIELITMSLAVDGNKATITRECTVGTPLTAEEKMEIALELFDQLQAEGTIPIMPESPCSIEYVPARLILRETEVI